MQHNGSKSLIPLALKQMFHLFAKIREVDRAITPQACIFECHPEAAFWAMNGRTPLAEPKKLRNRPHAPGLEKRLALLFTHGFSESFLREARFPAVAGRLRRRPGCLCVLLDRRPHFSQ